MNCSISGKVFEFPSVWQRKFFSYVGWLMAFLLLNACSSGPGRYVGKKYWHSSNERPYVINGVMYYPQVHYVYSSIGEASWYGYDCHGKPTAIGRRFDKNKLTAAHRTLPLPSVVLVENLENGRKIKLLVNDRGPFAKTNRRIIDVTQRAAYLLGFRNKGHARVRVTCLPQASRMAAIAHKRKPYR
jgi:rare lipoprotein A (peptidoglycan hydrolase)